MQINLNVDLEKMRQKQKQKQKIKTGMSMQSTVNSALNLPTQGGAQQMPAMNNPKGWGANAQ